jgi:hypothetical protein
LHESQDSRSLSHKLEAVRRMSDERRGGRAKSMTKSRGA